MWPFQTRDKKKAVVVFHIDHDGQARGAYFRGDADVLIIDERDPADRVFLMGTETSVEDLRRKIGKHPLGQILADKPSAKARPVLNLHWQNSEPQAV
jgi:hypothetical protein